MECHLPYDMSLEMRIAAQGVGRIISRLKLATGKKLASPRAGASWTDKGCVCG